MLNRFHLFLKRIITALLYLFEMGVYFTFFALAVLIGGLLYLIAYKSFGVTLEGLTGLIKMTLEAYILPIFPAPNESADVSWAEAANEVDLYKRMAFSLFLIPACAVVFAAMQSFTDTERHK